MTTMCRRTALSVLVAVCILPVDATAQPAAQDSAACFARIPASDLVPVPVHLQAEPSDSAGKVLRPLMDALVERAVLQVRQSLGEDPSLLPAAEPRITWRTVGNGLVVHVHRNGVMTWSPPSADSQGHAPSPGTLLLQDALREISDSGYRIFVPRDSGVDSLGFLITWRVPTAVAGGYQPLPLRHAVPVFSLRVPVQQPVRALRGPRISYPERPRGYAEGTVVLSFIVDARGRPDRNTVNAYWPPDRPPLKGELGDYYRLFVAAARRGVGSMRFEPALLGGCPVRQLVHLPIDFVIKP